MHTRNQNERANRVDEDDDDDETRTKGMTCKLITSYYTHSHIHRRNGFYACHFAEHCGIHMYVLL